MYFEALASGGGSDWFYTVILKAPLGASIVVDDGDEEVEAVGTGNYIGIPVHNANSTYTITVETNGLTAPTQTVTTGSDSGEMSTPIDFNFAAINMTYDEEFRGQNATVTDGTHTASVAIPAAPSTSVTIYVPYTGNWTISAVDPVSGNTFYTNPNPVVVSSLTQTINAILYVIPDGKTVTPTDDISLWLMCANIKDKNYTTLDEVLADEDCLFRLLTSDNANDYLKRSTTWINAGLVPTMIDSTHPSGHVTASAEYTSSYPAWKAFNESEDYGWGVFSTKAFSANDWVQYEFPTAQVARKVHYSYKFSTGDCTFTFKIQGSNDGFVSDVNDLCAEQSNVDFVSNTRVYKNIELNNSVAYKYYRLFITSDASSNGGYGIKLQFYPLKEGITENELAMQIIGADDYATETLLDDSDWAEAIAKSEYRDEILGIRIPIMTSDTTPSGNVTAQNNYYGSNYKWKAFDNDDTTYYCSYNSMATGMWLQYEFADEGLVPEYIRIRNLYVKSGSTFKIQGSNDGFSSDIHDLVSKTMSANVENYDIYKSDISNADKYKYFRIYLTNVVSGSSDGWSICEFGVFGRENGVQTWLKTADIQKPYTTLDEVLADRDTLAALMANETAVDYLVTAKRFIEDICADETAMKYIGKNNYAADALLADEEWFNAIINSTYMESVLNAEVPIMTSNTTPSGEAYASSEYADSSTTYKAFFAYRGMGGWGWYPSGNPNGAWVAYDFGKNIPVYKVKFMPTVNTGYQFSTVKIQASIDKAFTNPVDVTGNISVTPSSNSEVLTTVVGEYRYYRILIVSATTTSGVAGIINANFYGREEVSNNSIDIYSAADDQVFYYDQNNNQVTIATTDSTGHATILRSNLSNGEYDLFSTVAKNPYDLSAAYHKKVKVTDDTIDIYVMPDEEIVYWYGYKKNFTINTGSTMTSYNRVSPTANLRDTTYSITGTYHSTFGSDNAENNVDKVKTVVSNGKNTGTGYHHFIFTQVSQLSNYPGYIAGALPTTNNDDKVRIEGRPTSYHSGKLWLFGNGTAGAQLNIKMHSMLYDKLGKIPTFLSAANDTLYILDGNTQIPIAYTDKYGESYDLMLEPGTYDIYSSVAKDPNNLFNPYHKQVTITEYTRTVKVMPDNTIFWFGYTNEELTGGWARGYNASSTSVARWSDGYLYTELNSTAQTISVCSNNKIPIKSEFSSLKAVYENLYGTANTAMYIYMGPYGPGVTVSGGYASDPKISKIGSATTSKTLGSADVTSFRNSDLYMHGSSVTGNTYPAVAKTYALWFE